MFAATAAWAEDTVKVKEVVVTAIRAEEQTEKLPANVTVITEEDINASTATTVQELLKEKESIIVRDLYGNGAKSTVDMRGFGRGLNTVILIDGRKVNEVDLSGVDWNLIPLENVERIEIVRGGGGVLYGDNAMAGVINIITKKGEKQKPELEAGGRLESYNGHSEHVSLRGAVDKFSYFVFGKYRETDGYRDNSNVRAKDVGGNVTFDITDTLYVGFRGNYHQDHTGLPGGLTEAQIAQNRRQTNDPGNGVDYNQSNLGVFAGVTPVDWLEIEAEYSHNRRDSDELLTGDFFGDTYSSVTARDIDTDEYKVKLTSRHEVFGHKNVLVTGVDRSRVQVDNDNVFDYFGTWLTLTDLEKRELGIYVQDDFYATDALTLSAGYRYTHAEYEAMVIGMGSGAEDFDLSAYHAGITYNYAEGAKVYASYSRDFRLPTTDELFDTIGNVTLLRPEKSDTFEVGVVHPILKGLTARVSAYHMIVNDELFLDPAVGYFGTNENADGTIHQGVEVGLEAEINDMVTLTGGWTYTRAQFDGGPYDGKTIPLIPLHKGNVGAVLSFTEAARLSADVVMVGSRFIENDLTNSLEKLDFYATADARFSYKYKGIEAFVGVKNILDQKFNDYGAVGTSGNRLYYPAPARNFYGGLKAVF